MGGGGGGGQGIARDLESTRECCCSCLLVDGGMHRSSKCSSSCAIPIKIPFA